MQVFKFTLILVFSLLLSNVAFAQKANKKLQQKAEKRTEKLNKQLMAGDEDAVLTAEQMEAITAVYVEMETEVRATKKSGGEKEDLKPIRKAARKEIFKEVLTREQRKAFKAGKEEKEDKD